MIAGATLTVVYRFRWRTERCMRAARDIEQDMRRREGEGWDRRRVRLDQERAAYLAVSPLATPVARPPYR